MIIVVKEKRKEELIPRSEVKAETAAAGAVHTYTKEKKKVISLFVFEAS